MELQGGMAGLRGVTFESDTHVVIAKYKDGEIVVNKREKKKKLVRIGNLFSKIPFLRAYWVLLEVFFMNATGLVLIGLNILLNLSYNKIPKSSSNLGLYLLLSIILFALLWIMFSPIGKFHGAEHKTANCYCDNGNVEISEVVKSSRRSRRCGSNIVVCLVVIVGILSLLIKDSWIPILLGWGITWELMRSDNKIVQKIAEPFYILGDKFQQYISTSEPTEREIKVAMASIKSLMED